MIKGLDISHYQNDKGAIDWAKVKKAGYDFVYIKATEALTGKDAYYKKNIAEARNAGLLVGSYHFARANDAIKEADFFLSVVGAMQTHDFLVLDWEIEYKDPDGWCRTFLDRCFEKTGVRPLLYTNEDRVMRIKWDKVVAGNYGLIAAKYGDNDAVLEENEIARSDEFPFVVIQQFTSNMAVPGIVGRVDANIGNLTLDALKKYGKQPESPAQGETAEIHIENQLDKKWSKYYLGKVKTSGFNLFGCHLFCWTYIYSVKLEKQISPAEVDKIFMDKGVYSGDLIDSAKAAKALGVEWLGRAYDITKAPNWYPTIKEVDFSIKDGKQQHFVIREYKNGRKIIKDPYGGVERKINYYEEKVKAPNWETGRFSYRLVKIKK